MNFIVKLGMRSLSALLQAIELISKKYDTHKSVWALAAKQKITEQYLMVDSNET
jgi:hypothetical protein